MRSLWPALLAAQRSASTRPYLRVELLDRIAGVRRLAFERLYTGSEPDSYHAVAMPSEGALLRARVSGGRVHYQRTPAPDAASDYSAWTDLADATDADVALCADGVRVLLFYVDTDGETVLVRESTDSGATLGSAVTAASAAGPVQWLAADVKAGGDALLLYSTGATVFAATREGGAWGSPAAWTNAAGAIDGLACHHQGDWNVAICGIDADGASYAWTCIFGDGVSQAADTWSPLREVMRASAGTGVGYRAPFLSQPDAFRLSFVEAFTGDGPYSRPYHALAVAGSDFADNLWREPAPFDLDLQFGQALAFSGEAVWASTPHGVWRATLGAVETDATADVIEAQVSEEPFGGRARLVLRNDDGRYLAPGLPFKTFAEVRISPGYHTADGPEVSAGPAYWVESIERRSGGGTAEVVIEARNGWWLLEGWRARRQYQWDPGEATIFGILRFLFSRAGLEMSSAAASAAATSLAPAFTVHPGEFGLTAVRRLLAKAPDIVVLRGEAAFLAEPLSAATPVYEYGETHPLFRAGFRDTVPSASRVQTFGPGVFGEEFDWPQVESSHDRLRQVLDAGLTTAVLAGERAETEIRRAAAAASTAVIAAPVNCGLELHDVVECNAPLAAAAPETRRVSRLELRYSTRGRPEYEQRIELRGV